MRASSTATLSLASSLRALDDTQLTRLITARDVREAGITDFFDLADTLLDSASIQRALTHLDRPTLAALVVLGGLAGSLTPLNNGGEADATGSTSAQLAVALGELGVAASALDLSLTAALEMALVQKQGDGWLAFEPVSDQLASWASLDLPDPQQLLSEPAPAALEPVSQSDARFTDHIAAEHAFATIGSVAELIAELRRDPARELARGGIALPDVKRLAAAMSVELESVSSLVSIASRAQLVALEGSSWLPADASADWLLTSTSDRWSQLAGAWFDRLPSDIKELLSGRAHSTWGARLADYLRWLYPAGGDWMRERSAIVTSDAELLGITAHHVPSTPGSALLSSGIVAATAAMTPLFPPVVDRVYVQQDLTIVSPGPLESALDARLRGIADVESRALATSYRVTQSSINRALASGETAASIRSFLGEISLTGIPQPLEYLIAGTAARYGLLRVGEIPADSSERSGDASSYIRSDDATLLGTISVDHTLSQLGITRVGAYRAVTRVDVETVFWALNEARYPVAAENSSGEIVELKARRVAHPVVVKTESPAAAIVRTLRAGGEPTSAESGKAWFERQLEAAIKGKFELTVTVQMPGGKLVEMQLEPAGLSGGRLRALDRKADTERTLPLSSITAITDTRSN